MKYLVVVFLFVSQCILAQTEKLSEYQKVLYTLENIQVKPELSNEKKKEFDDFLKSNFKNPKAIRGSLIEVNFIVEMDGAISSVEIVKDDNFGSGKELKRVLEMLPKWLPGEHEGYHVRTKINYIYKV